MPSIYLLPYPHAIHECDLDDDQAEAFAHQFNASEAENPSGLVAFIDYWGILSAAPKMHQTLSKVLILSICIT